MDIEKYVIVHKTVGSLFAYYNESLLTGVGFTSSRNILHPCVLKFDSQDSAGQFLHTKENGVQRRLNRDYPGAHISDLVIKKFRFTVEII